MSWIAVPSSGSAPRAASARASNRSRASGSLQLAVAGPAAVRTAERVKRGDGAGVGMIRPVEGGYDLASRSDQHVTAGEDVETITRGQ